jgi:multidrug efflux pump subunit AcrB
MIMGYSLSILSFFGIVALSGVVVNDSLLLIDTVNIKRREGAELQTALGDAGTRRFRPILLTSLTTFFGLSPMILETSVQAQFLIPMAISLGFGILFATGITLLLIPCLYMMLEDVRRLFGLGMSKVHGESEPSR